MLINGMHVLVTTPPCLVRLINDYKAISMRRCCHIVFESAHSLFENHEKDIWSITRGFLAVKRSSDDWSSPEQMIVVSELWTEAIRDFVEKFMISTHRYDLNSSKCRNLEFLVYF